MKYVLDTDTISFLGRNYPRVSKRFGAMNPSEIFTTTVNFSEVYYGLYKKYGVNGFRFDESNLLINNIPLLKYDRKAAKIFAAVKSQLRNKGIVIDDLNIQVASIVLANEDAILITNNIKDFNRIPGLRIENWA